MHSKLLLSFILNVSALLTASSGDRREPFTDVPPPTPRNTSAHLTPGFAERDHAAIDMPTPPALNASATPTTTSLIGTSNSIATPEITSFLRDLRSENIIETATSRDREAKRYSYRSKLFETVGTISAATAKTVAMVGTCITTAIATNNPEKSGDVAGYFLATSGTCSALYCGFTLMSQYYQKRATNAENELKKIMDQANISAHVSALVAPVDIGAQ